MKLSSVKTRQQFYDFSDVWYQRTHKLRWIWQDESMPSKKRIKAYLLFVEMYSRVLKLNQVAIKINQPKPLKNN